MTIKILGTGCPNCRRLEAQTLRAIEQLGLQADIEKVEDIGDIVAYGVMSTPALVVDEQVVLSGRVPTVPEVATLLANTR